MAQHEAFALQHGIKIQTLASWIQTVRHDRGDYQNEAVWRNLRMRKTTTISRPQKKGFSGGISGGHARQHL